MAKSPTRKSTRAQAKKRRDAQVRKDLAILKKKGLYKGELRRRTPTDYGRRLTRDLADVVKGDATVVTVGKRSKVREYKGAGFRGRFNKVVVPKKGASDTARYNKRAGIITVTREDHGIKRKVTIAPQRGDTLILPKPKKGKKYMFVVPFGGGQRMRFDTAEQMIEFMMPYETAARNPYHNWRAYVEIEEMSTGAATDGN